MTSYYRKETKGDKLTVMEMFVIVECLLVFAIYFFTIFEQETLTSLCIAANYVVVAGMTAFSLMIYKSGKMFYLWFFLVAASMYATFVTAGSITFTYLKKWLMFTSTVNMFFWVTNTKISLRMIKSIKITTFIIAVLFVFAYITGRTGSPDEFNGALTFNFSNPNMTGISLLAVCLHIFVMAIENKVFIKKNICLALAVILTWFIFKTSARSCIVAMVAFFIISFFKKKYSRVVTFMVVIFPLIFVILYMKLIDTDFISIFEFMESEGKSLTSRERIWEYVIQIIKMRPLFGHYYVVTKGSGLANLHNIHLDTLAAYGTITFILKIWFLNAVLNAVGNNNTKNGNFSIIAFYAVLLSGTFEAALFSGSEGVYFIVGGFLMLTKYHNKSEKSILKGYDYKKGIE